MKLYYSDRSPFARNVRVVLYELGLEFESDKLNAMRPLKAFSELNPGVAIPVLEDDGQVLFDSKVITQYLLQTSPECAQKSAETTPFLKVWAREDHKWEDLKLLSTLETLTETLASMLHVRKGLAQINARNQTFEYLERHDQRIDALFDWINERVTPKGFVPGSFTVMDIQLMSALSFSIAADVYDWRGRPILEAAYDEFAERNSIMQTEPVFFSKN